MTPTDTPAPMPALAPVLSPPPPPGTLFTPGAKDADPVAVGVGAALVSLALVKLGGASVLEPPEICDSPGVVGVGAGGGDVEAPVGPIVAANANMLDDVLQHDFGPQHHLLSPHEFTGAFSSCHYAIALVSRASSFLHAE